MLWDTKKQQNVMAVRIRKRVCVGKQLQSSADGMQSHFLCELL